MNKMINEVHQILHGYDGGHRRLAGSTRLLSEDGYLIDRISDLSGSLLDLKIFDPYFTGYPLPNKEYYALAKTWPDLNAKRSGTVLTHTLLIPIFLMQKEKSFGQFIKYFDESPDVTKINKYQQPILFIPSYDNSDSSLKGKIDSETLNIFANKYFGLGQRPILFIDIKNPIDIVIQIMDNLWPSIQSEFAFCTLSLQYRTLKAQPFDILFAPTSRIRKHLEISNNNIVEYSSNLNEHLGGDDSSNEFLETIFNPFTNRRGIIEKYPSIWNNLKSDPDVLKSFLAFDELMLKRTNSINAYLGILDLLHHMIIELEKTKDFQNSLIIEALNQIGDKNSGEEELNFLNLLCNKLEKRSPDYIKESVWYKFSTIVEVETKMFPQEAMILLNNSINNEYEELSHFDIGVVKGIIDIDLINSENLLKIKPELIFVSPIAKQYPELISSYYKLAQSSSIKQEASNILSDLIANESTELNVELFIDLLLESGQYEDGRVFKELLCKDYLKNVNNIFNGIAKKPGILKSEEILNLSIEYISKKYPEEIINWGYSHDYINGEMLALVSSAYKFDEVGFLDLLEYVNIYPTERIGAPYYYYKFNSGTTIPDWYVKTFQQYNELLALLVSFCISLWPNTKDFILNLIEVLTADLDFPVDKLFLSTNYISDSRPSIIISNLIANNQIKKTIKIGWSKSNYKNLFSNLFYIEWFGNVSEDDFNNTLLLSINTDLSIWEKTWEILEILPKSFYKRKPTRYKKHILINSIEKLLNIESNTRIEKISKTWITIIKRSKELKLNDLHFALCDQALSFSFNHTHLSVSDIVRETFPTVYTVAYANKIPRSFLSKLFWNSNKWDKAKVLRNKITNAYLESKWPAKDLALSMPNRDTFSLIFNRIYKQSTRDINYLEQMKIDLEKLNNKKAKLLLSQLNEMLDDPDFYVPWD